MKNWWKLSLQVCYKQKIGAHDVFLGLGEKDASTMSCEELIGLLFFDVCAFLKSFNFAVKVYLPGSKIESIQLDVAGNQFVVRSPK